MRTQHGGLIYRLVRLKLPFCGRHYPFGDWRSYYPEYNLSFETEVSNEHGQDMIALSYCCYDWFQYFKTNEPENIKEHD